MSDRELAIEDDDCDPIPFLVEMMAMGEGLDLTDHEESLRQPERVF